MSRPFAALLAGFIAILLNSLLLSAADFVPLATAHGGLLRLLKLATGLDLPATATFQWEFHMGVGLAMALAYAFVLEPLLWGSAAIKGLIYAIIVWMLNATVVLPRIGEGFAGSNHLTLAGMTWFAAAHTAFFIALAILYQVFRGSAYGLSGRVGSHSRP